MRLCTLLGPGEVARACPPGARSLEDAQTHTPTNDTARPATAAVKAGHAGDTGGERDKGVQRNRTLLRIPGTEHRACHKNGSVMKVWGMNAYSQQRGESPKYIKS